jgi:hypothetical protein
LRFRQNRLGRINDNSSRIPACNKRLCDDTIMGVTEYGPLAQLVEQGTLNALVLGSSPRRLRNKIRLKREFQLKFPFCYEE